MCGKFTQMASWPEVAAFSRPLSLPAPDAPLITATPMRSAQVLHTGADGERRLSRMRWGFTQAAGPSSRLAHIHARAETADIRPAFAADFARRRGLVVVQTFNEGETSASGRMRQWVIAARDRQPLAIAVIWRSEAGQGGPEPAFVMLTAPANRLIARITDRMPAVIRQQDWPVWLGETGAALQEVKALLGSFDDEDAWEMHPQAATGASLRTSDKRQPDLF